jgi:hypothetical membrane protein
MDHHNVNGMGRTPARVLAVGGIVAPLMWAAAVVYCGAIVPGYSHSQQYISELAAQGSPAQRVMQATGFVIPGVLIAAFGVSIGMRTRDRLVGLDAACVTLTGLCRVAAGLLPCDAGCGRIAASASQQLHDIAGAMFVLVATGAAALWVVIDVRAPARSIWFSALSLATVTLAIGAPPLLIATGIANSGDVGTFQRVSLGTLNVWLLVLALRQWRRA